MNFDILISILLFVFFIVVPLLSRLQGRRQPPTRSRPVRPTTPAQVDQDRASVPQQSGDLDDSFLKRLEEARRRVQEALDADSVPSEPRQKASPPPQDTVVSPEPATTAHPFLPARTPSKTPVAVPTRVVNRADMWRTDEVQPPVARRSLSSGVISVKGRSIVQGLIWHMILSEPLGKTDADRRIVSQPRLR